MTAKVITVKQPWAWFLAKGYKPVENRTWYTNYRGPILVQSSKAPKFDFSEAQFLMHHFGIPDSEILEPDDPATSTGSIVGITMLTDCVSHHASPFFTGPYGFVMDQARQTEPFEIRGKLNIFNYPLNELSPEIVEVWNEYDFAFKNKAFV